MFCWTARTPGLQSPSEELLRGIAVRADVVPAAGIPTTRVVQEEMYSYLPSDLLPKDFNARLSVLFEIKSKYLSAELEPYLTDMFGGAGQPKSLGELLVSKFQRIDDYYYTKKLIVCDIFDSSAIKLRILLVVTSSI